MSDPTFTELDYVAHMLYGENRGSGHSRWWCLREDIREEYRNAAAREMEAWATFESGCLTRSKQMRSNAMDSGGPTVNSSPAESVK